MILITLRIPIRPEKTDEWLALAKFYEEAVNAEPGCMFFTTSKALFEDVYIIVEGFTDGDAGAEHMKQPHVARFFAEMPDIVSARPDIIYIDSPETSGYVEMGEIAPRET
jgi:quinol monooxygenase YgiN